MFTLFVSSVDFFLYYFVCLQSKIFVCDAASLSMDNPDGMNTFFGGGDNKDIIKEIEEMRPNPYPDFTFDNK